MDEVSRNNLKVIESYNLLESGHELTLPEIRLIQLFLTKVNFKEEGIQHELYSIDTNEYASIYEITQSWAYHGIVELVQSIMTKVIDVKAKVFDSNAKESARVKFHWFDFIEYDPSVSSVKMRPSERLCTILGNLGEDNHYFSYYLEKTRRMQSVYSIRMFKLGVKWNRVGRFYITLEEMRRALGIGSGLYGNVSDLRCKVILPAMLDVEKHGGIKMDMIQRKEGRNVIGFEFKVGKVREG